MHTVYQPKGILRKIGFAAVNRLLRFQGLSLPPEMSLFERVATLRHGTETDIQNFCSKCLLPGMTAIDIGANCGLLTRYFRRQVGGNGRVFGFEPDPSVFQFAQFNTRRFANVEVIQSAVSDNEEPVVLHLNDASSAGNSLFSQTHSSSNR